MGEKGNLGEARSPELRIVTATKMLTCLNVY